MPDVYVAGGGEPSPTRPIEGSPQADVKTEPGRQVSENRGQSIPREMISEILRKAGEMPRKALWGAYSVRPGKKFINEQMDEEVVLLLRAHPVTNSGWILLVILGLILPGLLVVIGIFEPVPAKFVFMGRLIWYLGVLGFGLEKFFNWYYSVFIVTNERLVDIDFINLLYRVVTHVNLNHIEEPSMTTGGLARLMFHYGDVTVSTAAENPNVEALKVPYPDKVVAIVSELAEELEKRRERGE